MRRLCPLATAFTVASGIAIGTASFAGAVDHFEIEVYDGTANLPGSPGLELHLNSWLSGHRTGTPPELPLYGQVHATLEPSFGVTRCWELGAYLQMAFRDDGIIDWAGVKARSKFVFPPDWDPHWRLGANFELAYVPSTYEADRWSVELRPIVAWHDARWLVAVNPIFGVALDGSGGPSFEPALKAARTIGSVAFGFEYYGDLGAVDKVEPIQRQEHYLFEALDVFDVGAFELNAAVGEGLTSSSAGIVVKVIVGYEWESLSATPHEHSSTYPFNIAEGARVPKDDKKMAESVR
jgi:hypothetical protein